MILHINNSEYDYHTLVKVAEMAGLAGLVGFHEPMTAILSAFRIQKTRGAYPQGLQSTSA